MYAGDVGLVAQAESFEKLEEIRNEDLFVVRKHFKSWHLTLIDPDKTTPIAFRLNKSDRKLNLMAQRVGIQREGAPKYSGIKLDVTFTFRRHLEGVTNTN